MSTKQSNFQEQLTPDHKDLSPWQLQNSKFFWGSRTYLMGVLNVTPDSFSDGGLFNTVETAVQQAQHLIASGADILDIGGQSTRPQAETISLETELDRVLPVIQTLEHLFQTGQLSPLPISIDTTRAAVARAAVQAGACLVNDVSGGTYDPDMFATVAELEVPIILMHLRGTPQTMQQLTEYENLLAEITNFLAQQIDRAIAADIPRDSIAVDPGIGFAKTSTQNLEILRRLPELKQLGCPILIGTSRKSFIGHLLNQPDPQQRIWGTAATCCAAIAAGADILRVHDVKQMREVCCVADAIWRE
jgi:dihydropteroate synthase